jgi:uncharacterized protein with PQ loop repeat
MNYVEIQHWGFNSLVMSALITALISVVQSYGLIRQSRKIRRMRSAQSLSAFLFFFEGSFFISFFFYGIAKDSLAMMFNGLAVGAAFWLAIVGIIRFKKLKTWEAASLPLTLLIIPLMILIKQKDLLLFILMLGGGASLLLQIVEMVREKSRGAIEIRFLLIFIISNSAWLVYSITISNWPLEITTSLSNVVYLVGLRLYFKYPATLETAEP